MTDVVDKATRSRMMSGIKGKDTQLELIIRKELHKLGYRYKLHQKRMTGKPDLVFPKYNAILFINGCFWHGHDCHLFKYPATQKEFWNEKLNKTKETDAQNISLLMKDGWRVLKIWECSLKGIEKIGLEEVISHTTAWLVSDNNFLEIRGIARN